MVLPTPPAIVRHNAIVEVVEGRASSHTMKPVECLVGAEQAVRLSVHVELDVGPKRLDSQHFPFAFNHDAIVGISIVVVHDRRIDLQLLAPLFGTHQRYSSVGMPRKQIVLADETLYFILVMIVEVVYRHRLYEKYRCAEDIFDNIRVTIAVFDRDSITDLHKLRNIHWNGWFRALWGTKPVFSCLSFPSGCHGGVFGCRTGIFILVNALRCRLVLSTYLPAVTKFLLKGR